MLIDYEIVRLPTNYSVRTIHNKKMKIMNMDEEWQLWGSP